MNIYPTTRLRFQVVDVTLDADPTGSTLELSIDGTWYPCAWQGSPVQSGTTWKQTGQTTGYFGGPSVTAPSTTILSGPDSGATVKRHLTAARVTWSGGNALPFPLEPIEVRA